MTQRLMDTLERADILKSARENGWEYCVSETPEALSLASARHRARAVLQPIEAAYGWQVSFQGAPITAELRRAFSPGSSGPGPFAVTGVPSLGSLLRRAAELAFALPDHGEALYYQRLKSLSAAGGLGGTEAERVVKQRVGQDTYRELMLEYWGGACALTGITVPETLRASHSKPWADCATDAERLDVYNGLLLVANLDALFDRGLLSISESGDVLISGQLHRAEAERLGCREGMRLRWMDAAHLPYLAWHREKVWRGGG